MFGISYGDDIRQAKEIARAVLDQDERVLKEPEPTIGVLELADSAVNLAVRPWVKTEEYWNVRYDLLERIKTRFDEASVTIPFPQRDVHIHKMAD